MLGVDPGLPFGHLAGEPLAGVGGPLLGRDGDGRVVWVLISPQPALVPLAIRDIVSPGGGVHQCARSMIFGTMVALLLATGVAGEVAPGPARPVCTQE